MFHYLSDYACQYDNNSLRSKKIFKNLYSCDKYLSKYILFLRMRTRSLTFIKDRFNHIAYHIYVYREFFVVFCCRSLVNRILKIEFYIICLQSCVFIVQPSSFCFVSSFVVFLFLCYYTMHS